MIKICHMTSTHGQKDVRIFQKECVSLVKEGYEVYLIAQGENCTEKGVHIIGFGRKPSQRWRRMIFSSWKTYRLAKKLDADIYHVHDPELLPYGYLLKKSGKTVIFDSHENLFILMQEKKYIPFLMRKFIERIFVRFLKKVCKKLDAIITVDPLIGEKYQEINERTIVIANFPILEEKERDSSVSETEKSGIAFAGGVDQQWNHKAVIEALEIIQEKIEYKVCGNADQSYLEELKTLPKWGQVDYRGVVPHSEALSILHNSMIGVALCNYSGNTNQEIGTLGNTKLFEIMMTGIPVICTGFEIWEDIVKKYSCGICIKNPQDSRAIADAVQYFLDNQEEAKRMGRQGRKAIMEKYHWGIEERKLVKLYEVLTNEV